MFLIAFHYDDGLSILSISYTNFVESTESINQIVPEVTRFRMTNVPYSYIHEGIYFNINGSNDYRSDEVLLCSQSSIHTIFRTHYKTAETSINTNKYITNIIKYHQ